LHRFKLWPTRQVCLTAALSMAFSVHANGAGTSDAPKTSAVLPELATAAPALVYRRKCAGMAQGEALVVEGGRYTFIDSAGEAHSGVVNTRGLQQLQHELRQAGLERVTTEPRRHGNPKCVVRVEAELDGRRCSVEESRAREVTQPTRRAWSTVQRVLERFIDTHR
jgi:hypothetical protein